MAVDREALLGQDYWVVFWFPVEGTSAEQFAALLDDHLSWMLSVERDGQVLASGPLLEGLDVTEGSGLTVFRAGTADEVGAIASADPFVRAGLRRFTLRRWRIMEGAITIRVSLGTGAYTFE